MDCPGVTLRKLDKASDEGCDIYSLEFDPATLVAHDVLRKIVLPPLTEVDAPIVITFSKAD